MKISEHADKTEKLYGLRAEDIHKWIDGFFDTESFSEFLLSGDRQDYNPYDHRKFRHCKEALEDAYSEFEGKYTRQQIKDIFECHLQDDYNGYLPCRDDFKNGTFTERYHEKDEQPSEERILSEIELAEYFKGKAYAGKKQNKQKITGFHLRIVLPTMITTALFIISIFTIVIPVSRNNMMESRKGMIKELVHAAESVIRHQIKLYEDGEITLQQAQETAASDIQALHYGLDMKDYFWITDTHPRMVMHPYLPELNGTDLTDYVDIKDKSKKKLFVEFVKLVNENGGEGFMEYLWQWQDNPNRHVSKLSYVKLIPEWNWIVGTGMYIHDVEEQINGLTMNLMWVFLAISIFLFIIILYIISQTRKIENERLQAESGLIEAKERYRALVEASNEGYMLMLDGRSIFSNHTLERMVGYDSEELAHPQIWNKILPDSELNKTAIGHLNDILNEVRTNSEFEARLKTKSGHNIDVIINISKIFFSEKKGHVVSIRKITSDNTIAGMKLFDNIQNYSELPSGIILEIESSASEGHIIHTMSRVPVMVKEMTVNGIKSSAIRQAICEIFDAVMAKLIELNQDHLGSPPVEYAFLTLGSNARREMTMFSDQDNAIIFDNVPYEKLDKIRRYFLQLADKVCTSLDKAGYPYCPGGIMAINPRWCLSLDEWKNRFTARTIQDFDNAALDIHTIFDIRCSYGSQNLTMMLQQHMMKIANENPEFFMHLARNCLGYSIPLGTFGNIKTETIDGQDTINVKDCIVPIVNMARLYSLKNNIHSPGTLTRINELLAKEIFTPSQIDDISHVFNHLWYLRFYNQIICHSNLQRVNDELNIENLSEVEQKNLKDSLAKINTIQSKLSFDFLGMPLS